MRKTRMLIALLLVAGLAFVLGLLLAGRDD